MFGLANICSLVGRASTVAFVASSSSSTAAAARRVNNRHAISSTTTALNAATQYVLKYDYIPDVLEKRGPYREGHLGLAKKLIEEGTCVSGGPCGPPGMEIPTGAYFIFTTEDAANLFVKEDPYVSNGIVTGHTIEEWNIVVSKE